jgi:hypothetical protein
MRTNPRAEATARAPPSAGGRVDDDFAARFLDFFAGPERFLTAGFFAIFSSPNDARGRTFRA